MLAFYACVVDRTMQLDFSTALEMTWRCLSTLYSRKTVAFARKRSGERGAATKRSCKARLRGLLRAQFAATSAWRNLGAQRRTKGHRPCHSVRFLDCARNDRAERSTVFSFYHFLRLLLSFRPSEAESRARGEISERSDGQKVIDHAIQLDFSTALEMTGWESRPTAFFHFCYPPFLPILSFRPSEAVSQARGEIPEHSDGQKVIDHAIQLDFSTALEMTGWESRPAAFFHFCYPPFLPFLSFCAKEERQRSEVARRVYAACLERSLPRRARGEIPERRQRTKRQRYAAPRSANLPQRFYAVGARTADKF